MDILRQMIEIILCNFPGFDDARCEAFRVEVAPQLVCLEGSRIQFKVDGAFALECAAATSSNTSGTRDEDVDEHEEYFDDSSDASTLYSDVEADAELEQEGYGGADEEHAGDDGDAREDPQSSDRAPQGRYTIFNNGYFTLSTNPNVAQYPDGLSCIRILPRWCSTEELGRVNV